MANRIEEYNIPATNFVTNTSRYTGSRILFYSDLNKITFETYKRQQIQESSSDKILSITPGTEYRPDLVSFHVYGMVDFWWFILEANNMKDVFDFKSGKTIRLPVNPF